MSSGPSSTKPTQSRMWHLLCCTSKESSRLWWAMFFTTVEKVLLPTFVLSLLLVGILSKVTKANFYFLQNNEPHSKRSEGKGTTLSTSSLLKCPNSTWPCFLVLPGAVLCTPIRLPSLLWETTFYFFVPVSLHKTHFSLSINLSHYMQSYPTWATLGVYCLQMLAEGYHILLL